MSDPSVPESLFARLEEVVRENERLRQSLAALQPAVGHFVVLVELADAVRQMRTDDSEEARVRVFELLGNYDEARHGTRGYIPPTT